MDEVEPMSPAVGYLNGLVRLLTELTRSQSVHIASGAEILTSTIAAGGLVHVFGTGHSHMLAEEMFYRAGGLVAVNPILDESLMLHAGALRSTEIERTPGVAQGIFSSVSVGPHDAVIVVSNSGGNVVCVELAELFRDAGSRVIAIVSRQHADSVGPGAGTSSKLEELADVVIDNHGVPGDASIEIGQLDARVGATSTVAGAAIVNALVVATAEALAVRGHRNAVLLSANTPGGDEHNRELLEPLRHRVRAL